MENHLFLALDQTSLGLKAKLFRGFGDSSRLSILECLRQGPLTVGEIVNQTGLSQPNTSNHLACLTVVWSFSNSEVVTPYTS